MDIMGVMALRVPREDLHHFSLFVDVMRRLRPYPSGWPLGRLCPLRPLYP